MIQFTSKTFQVHTWIKSPFQFRPDEENVLRIRDIFFPFQDARIQLLSVKYYIYDLESYIV